MTLTPPPKGDSLSCASSFSVGALACFGLVYLIDGHVAARDHEHVLFVVHRWLEARDRAASLSFAYLCFMRQGREPGAVLLSVLLDGSMSAAPVRREPSLRAYQVLVKDGPPVDDR